MAATAPLLAKATTMAATATHTAMSLKLQLNRYCNLNGVAHLHVHDSAVGAAAVMLSPKPEGT